MERNSETRNLQEWLDDEVRSVDEFLAFFQETSDVSFVVYTEWTAKDVLGHITSWHLSYARNLLAAVKGEKPQPFRGTLGSINEGEVKRMAAFTTAELLDKLAAAQTVIVENILNPKVTEIVYRAGARSYSPAEHLEVVSRHVRHHLQDLRKKV